MRYLGLQFTLPQVISALCYKDLVPFTLEQPTKVTVYLRSYCVVLFSSWLLRLLFFTIIMIDVVLGASSGK